MNTLKQVLMLIVIGSVALMNLRCSRLSGNDADQIAFTSNRDGNDEIYLMNIDGTNQLNMTNHPSDDSHPVWSPDGRHIAFTSDRDGATDIFVMNSDGSEQINLTNSPGYDYFPTWSPDGKQILFVSYRDKIFSTQGDPVPEVYVMNWDGSNPQRLTNNEDDESYSSWAPQGDLIVLAISTRSYQSPTSNTYAKEIFTMDLTGKILKQLTELPDGNEYPIWSPDGTRIVFMSYRHGASEIYSMSADGSNQTRLTIMGATISYNLHPSWSPDGIHIVFSSNRDGNYEIYVMDADGSNLTRLTNNESLDIFPAWSPRQ